MKKLFFACLFVLCGAVICFAQDSSQNVEAGQFAVGYTIPRDIPSFVVRFQMDYLWSIEGALGFSTGDNEDAFLVGGKAIYLLKTYNKLDVYATGFVQVGTKENAYEDNKGFFRAGLGGGVEYFIIPQLSISTELGLAFDSYDSKSSFATFASWLPEVGVRYYF
jgi:hypothetical protein